jgi:hypothetical protein
LCVLESDEYCLLAVLVGEGGDLLWGCCGFGSHGAISLSQSRSSSQVACLVGDRGWYSGRNVCGVLDGSLS